jgi:hypothetical protein
MNDNERRLANAMMCEAVNKLQSLGYRWIDGKWRRNDASEKVTSGRPSDWDSTAGQPLRHRDEHRNCADTKGRSLL